ncbi:ankyrin repeat-containing protein [Methylocaldum marinum]|uniref:Ankyrin repeat-containing protein n=1 Tax=Methylocaldum marinum TaxID=1432792 RepID=A0A250KNK2_9GAMM|nr:ankyrin repeat domain-containing protein [Methylocaldum marinum]BBA33270.1 ankyrin repeat-containing protein [Methylocaldum marinum]
MTERTEYFEDADAIVTAVLLGDFDAAELLVKRGVDINAQDEIGRTAIMMAIEEDWAGTAWVEFLIENGADVNALDKDGDSALDIAKYRRRNDIVELLLANGAKGKDGASAKELRDDSIYAAFEQADVVKRLVAEIEKKKP